MEARLLEIENEHLLVQIMEVSAPPVVMVSFVVW